MVSPFIIHQFFFAFLYFSYCLSINTFCLISLCPCSVAFFSQLSPLSSFFLIWTIIHFFYLEFLRQCSFLSTLIKSFLPSYMSLAASPLTLIWVAIKNSIAGRLKVIYDPHIIQWQASFLCRVRCLCVCLTHRSSQRPEEVDSLCVPVRGTWKWNIANPKTVPESWEPQDSGTVFKFAIFHFQVPETGTQS
jgi:hypothetical protein